MKLLPARVVTIDDPSPYRNRHAVRQDGTQSRFGIGVAARYGMGVMTEEDLCALGPYIRAVSMPEAYVFPWATRPNKDLALRVLDARGLHFTTEPFSWVKLYPNGKHFCGAGAYTFSNQEDVCSGYWQDPNAPCDDDVIDVVLGLWPKSKLWHSNKGWRPNSVIEAVHPRYPDSPDDPFWDDPAGFLFSNVPQPPAVHPRYPDSVSDPEWDRLYPDVVTPPAGGCGEKCRCRKCLAGKKVPCRCRACVAGKIAHSRKPEEFQDRLDRWLDPYIGDFTKIELFATRQRPGWLCLGHELSGRDIRDELRELAEAMGTAYMLPAREGIAS